MRTSILLLLLSAASALGQAFGLSDVGFAGAIHGSRPCSVASGDLFNETFQASGFVGTWTTNGVATQNAGASTTGRFDSCTALGSYCYNANAAATAVPWCRTDLGAGSNSDRYFRLYLYISAASVSTGSTVDMTIFTWSNTSDLTDFGGWAVALFLHNGGSGQLQLRTYSGASAVRSSTINVSSGTMYRWECAYKNNNASGIVWRLYDSAGAQVGSDITQTTVGTLNNPHYVGIGVIGNNTGDTANLYYDGIGVSSTGYLGQ